MAGGATVHCRTISSFPNESYRTRAEKLGNAIIVPEVLLGEEYLDVEPFSYVHAKPADDPNADGQVIPVVPFSADHPSESFKSDGYYDACLRTVLQGVIGCNVETGSPRVTLTATDESRARLRTARVASSTFFQSGFDYLESCFVDESVRARLGTAEGEPIELMSTQTGGRIPLAIYDFQQGGHGADRIRIHSHARRLLGVVAGDEAEDNAGDEVILRKPPGSNPSESKATSVRRRLKNSVARWFVDYNAIRLRVLPGRDRDEDQNVVRTTDDVLQLLGVDEGDEVVLEWYGKRRTARCLAVGDTEEEDVMTVHVPSTERDRLQVGVNDCVRVRRDMGYVMGERITVSLFGFLGVFISLREVSPLLLGNLGPLGFLGSVLLIALGTVWLILWPERQRCRKRQ